MSSAADSLAATFYRAQRSVLADRPRTSAEATALVEQITSLAERVRQAELFSANEDADDLSTTSLKYLLVPYYAGQVESSFPCGLGERLAHLTRGVDHFAEFGRRLGEYKLGEKSELIQLALHTRDFRAKLAATAASSSSSSSAIAARPRPVDPNAARTAKIARYKREKELSQQLEAMQSTRRARISAQGKTGAPNNTIGSSADALDEEALDAAGDDADVRAFYQLLFQSSLLSAVDGVKGALDEVDILLHHRDVELRKPKDQQLANMNDTERQRVMMQGDPKAGQKPVMYKMTPESLNQPIPAHMQHLLQGVVPPQAQQQLTAASAAAAVAAATSSIAPSTITSNIDSLIASRSNARGEVFKLTNQPTMSIEQWAEGEIAAGRMAGPNDNPQPRGPDPRRIVSAHDREVAAELQEAFQRTNLEDEVGLGHEDGAAGAAQDEIKTMKDREWDNWKDDHQKGVGNSMK
jgi:immunoglobulin-binding protein 1